MESTINSNKEIEVKILNIDVEKVRKTLLDAGAEKVFYGGIDVIHYDFPDFRIKNSNCYFRLRKKGEKTELVFKGDYESDDYATREETETKVEDFEKMKKIIAKLGMVIAIEYKKKRETYKLGNTLFEIDFYPDFPAFIEVEAPREEDVQKGVKLLGYTMNDTYARSIGAYMEENNIDPKKFGFKVSEAFEKQRSGPIDE
jgi:adenylate cyclase, class 2